MLYFTVLLVNYQILLLMAEPCSYIYNSWAERLCFKYGDE